MDTLQAAVDSLTASVTAAVARLADLKAKQEDPAKIQDLVNKLTAADQAIKAALA